ncbi:MAG: sugar ABC transporter permease [Clostridiales bacterium]|nr:sugar ABC transporter permease [Clostridiales bacterium]
MDESNNKIGTRRVNYRRKKQIVFFTSLVVLPLFQFCIFYIYVNINSFILAFQEYSWKEGVLGLNVEFARFKNFSEAFGIMKAGGNMLLNSFWMFILSTVFGLTLALFFSYYIYKKNPCSGLFRVILFMPQIVSSVVFAVLYNALTSGVYSTIMTEIKGEYVLGLIDNPDTQFGTLLFYNLWIGFGVNVLMFCGSMSGIDESLVESAHLDGANLIQEFFHVTIPMIWPTFVSFFIVGVTGIFTNQMHLHTLFGDGAPSNLMTFGYYLYKEAGHAELISTGVHQNISVLSALGLILTAIVMPLTLGLRWALNKYGPSVD